MQIDIEVWATVPNTNIEVSTHGRVKGPRGIRTPKSAPAGYIQISVWDKSRKRAKVYNLHKLIAEVFIPNAHNKDTVNHIDGNRTNNWVGNLEWCTRAEQEQHKRDTLHSGNTQKLTRRQAAEIKYSCLEPKTLAEQYYVHIDTIHRIRGGRTWKQITKKDLL